MVDIELLKDCEWITVLSNEEKDFLLSNLTKVQYKMGESIVKNGEFTSHIVYIVSGYVKTHSDFKNKTLILAINRPGSFPGFSTMMGITKHKFDITAIDDTVICLINIEIFRYFIENNGLFALKVLQNVNETLLQYIDYNLVSLSYCNIYGRLANILLYFADQVFCSDNFDLLLSRKELAQFANISRENVIKVLYEFRNEGIIAINNKNIRIIQPDMLRHYAEV